MMFGGLEEEEVHEWLDRLSFEELCNVYYDFTEDERTMLMDYFRSRLFLDYLRRLNG